jgi:hypothetical protein
MSESPQRQYPVLVGIGCGRVIHSKQMPLDLAIYFKGADIIRDHLNTERGEHDRGVVVIADEEVMGQDGEPDTIVTYRRERVQKTLQVLNLTEWDVVMQSDIVRDELAEIHIDEELPEEDIRYIQREVDDARRLIQVGGTKVGWVRNTVQNLGGERMFDDQIAILRPDIHFTYRVDKSKNDRRNFPRLIGIPLSSQEGEIKPPYLVKKPEEYLRLCLPTDETQLEREMAKLKRNPPSGLAKQRIKDFCTLVRQSVGITLERCPLPSLNDQVEQALSSFLR